MKDFLLCLMITMLPVIGISQDQKVSKKKYVQAKFNTGIKLTSHTRHRDYLYGVDSLVEQHSSNYETTFSPEIQLVFKLNENYKIGFRTELEFLLTVGAYLPDIETYALMGGLFEYTFSDNLSIQASMGVSDRHAAISETSNKGFFCGISTRLMEHLQLGLDFYIDKGMVTNRTYGFHLTEKRNALSAKVAYVF